MFEMFIGFIGFIGFILITIENLRSANSDPRCGNATIFRSQTSVARVKRLFQLVAVDSGITRA
jgi:hypothetical protein